MKVFIVGAGMAGHALVEELLKAGKGLDIHLFGDEKALPYNRIFLADIIAGRKLPSQLLLKSYLRYEEEGVRLHLGERVERIFPDMKKIITSKGGVYSYDKLVLAVGSTPYIPPIKGVEKKGVFTFRSLRDVYEIMDMARVSKRAIVIGGGLLGIELASSLRELGLEVFLIHILDRLMEQWLDHTASKMLSKRLEDMGIKLMLKAQTVEILGGKRSEGVRLSTDEVIYGDFVVLATGVKPNTSLAVASNLKVNKGILVNDFLETSAQDVYAVGECIEHRGRTFGLLSPVMEQVRVCARNLLYGNVEKYEGSVEYALLKVAGVRLLSAGRVHESGEDEIALYRDKENYRKAVVSNGKLVGVILYGNLSGSEKMLSMIKSGEGIKDYSFLIKDLIVEERELKPEDTVCNCNLVSYADILKAIREGARTIEDVQRMTKASTFCGGCAPIVEEILKKHVKARPQRINKVEEYKRAKHPFERELIQKLEAWAEEGDWQKIPEEDRDIGLKWYGIFYRKATPGYFMVRVRITHGKLSSEQALVLAHLSKKFGRNDIDITSRQQIQLRWIEVKDLPKVLEAIESVGLSTLQTGMDNIRNITGDPLSGLVEESLIDTVPIARRITEVFLGKKQYADLPRKFNLALLGSERDCINCRFNDLCFSLAVKDGKYGFNVYGGGKIGSGGPEPALDLNMFVLPYESIELSKAVFELYSDMGNREDRNKNRFYFLIKELGVEGLREELERRLLRRLEDKGQDLVKTWGEREGIIEQKNGLYTVSLMVPGGIFTGEDLETVAHLSRRYGSGEIRLSVYQNIYIVNVPEEKLNDLLNHPIFEKYSISTSPYFTNLIACQGSRTCAFGVIENKPDAIRLANYLSEHLPTDKAIRMHWSGCAKGCGQHGAGDLGFVGTKMRFNGEVMLAVEVFLKGKKLNTVPLKDINEYVRKLIMEGII